MLEKIELLQLELKQTASVQTKAMIELLQHQVDKVKSNSKEIKNIKKTLHINKARKTKYFQ